MDFNVIFLVSQSKSKKYLSLFYAVKSTFLFSNKKPAGCLASFFIFKKNIYFNRRRKSFIFTEVVQI
jgi:hypothetical protein